MVVGSLIYSVVRVLVDVLAASHVDQANQQAGVLASKTQVQVPSRREFTPDNRALRSPRSS